MKNETTTSIDTPTAELIATFRGALAEVRFPGVDASVLGKASEQVTTRAAEVETLRQALEEANASLEAERTSLRTLARQAHAYARVYAVDNDDLLQQLDAIVFDMPRARAAKKPRAKRSKPKTPQLMLENDPVEQIAS